MVEINTGKLINMIKEHPESADQLLYPGKQLCDFDETKLKVDILPSGFPGLDRKYVLKRGRGELVIIGARPGIGKSGLGFQIATNIAKWGKAHIFSLEMDHESVVARQIAAIMGRPIDYVQSGGTTNEEVIRVKSELSKFNCVIDDRAGLNVYQICDAARMQNKKSKTDIIIVDYLQIVSVDKSDYSRAVALGRVSSELKNLAKELRIPVIALSQLNRASEVRDAKTGQTKNELPSMSQLKESGNLEQDADVVLLIHRPKDIQTSVKVIVDKNRNGPTGEVNMRFAPAQCKFIDEEEGDLG